MTEDQTNGANGGRPQTVADLLERIARERGALEQAVAGMSDDALVANSGGWSAKDQLAHVAAWERRLIGELQGDRAAEHFGLDEADSTASADILNAMMYARHKDDPPTAVRAEFRESSEALRAVLAELSDADLMRPVRPEDPAVDTLVELISLDTYAHYPEHVAAISGRG